MAEPSLAGRSLELDVSAVAHGGSCVARHEGRVVFVRHALPGERVRALVTEDRGGSFVRADAVEILAPAPGRVAPPCPYAGPGRCGGCDWQHADGPTQRALKADVIREQFRRLARLDVTPLLDEVEELPGGLLGWRTRVTYATASDGRLGLHKHRSSEVQLIDRCLLGVDGVGNSDVLQRPWPGVTGVEAVRGEDGQVSVLTHRPGPGRHARGRRPPDRVEVVAGPDSVAVSVAGHGLSVAAGGFWQVHPHAADAYAAAVLGMAAPAPGEHILELYAGAGALTVVLADAVGPSGGVVAVESNAVAVDDARRNTAAQPWVRPVRARIDAGYIESISDAFDLAVVDPPRSGLGIEVTRALLSRRPRAVAYVACDPAALARDVRVALDLGWRLGALRAFDAFPMTHHVECVALLVPA